MNSKPVSNASVWLFLSCTLFFACLFFETVILDSHAYQNPHRGIIMLLFGILGILGGQFHWFANPLLFSTWIAINGGRKYSGILCGGLSLCIALTVIGCTKMVFDINGAQDTKIVGLAVGYWLWVLSIAFAMIGAISMKAVPRRSDVLAGTGASTIERNGFVKILVNLPNRSKIGAESMWAKDLGAGNYQIKNIPFCAYGLNLEDIVFAKTLPGGTTPVIQNLVEANGHKTLRVLFIDDGTKAEHIETIKSLKTSHIKFERNDSGQYALDVAPGGDFNGLLNSLEELELKLILKIEMCGARIEGSFDDSLAVSLLQ